MAKVAGYIIRLSKERYVSLRYNIYDRFVEPVPNFRHPRNIPLVCFVVDEAENITYIGMGSRGERAGTDLSKMNIKEIYPLQQPFDIWSIIDIVSSKVRYDITRKVRKGGLLGEKSFEEFLAIFLRKAPDTVQILEKYTKERASHQASFFFSETFIGRAVTSSIYRDEYCRYRPGRCIGVGLQGVRGAGLVFKRFRPCKAS